MAYVHDHAHPDNPMLTESHAGRPHALAPQRYYMPFAVNNVGVLSEGRCM